MPRTKRELMIIAGEASGDLHAAKLVRAIRDNDPDHQYGFFGSAGPNMREAGVEALVAADEMSVVGLAEIAGALPMFLRARRSLLKAARERKPGGAVLVDFPDFNLKLARSLKNLNIPVFYYISPQVWAWRKYRLAALKRNVDLLLTILPFEASWFRSHGVENVEYVGSPLAREVFPTLTKREFCLGTGLDADRPIVALLPGSRRKEVDRIMPVMAGAAGLIRKRDPFVQFAVAAASEAAGEQIRGILSDQTFADTQPVPIVTGETYNLLYAADAAAVTSGTATMEAGIIGTPLVVVYKTSKMNYALLEPLISVEHYGLINLIAEKRIAKELIQDDFTPSSLADEIVRLLDPEENALVRTKLVEAAERLGHGGASKRAAELIINLLSRSKDQSSDPFSRANSSFI